MMADKEVEDSTALQFLKVEEQDISTSEVNDVDNSTLNNEVNDLVLNDHSYCMVNTIIKVEEESGSCRMSRQNSEQEPSFIAVPEQWIEVEAEPVVELITLQEVPANNSRIENTNPSLSRRSANPRNVAGPVRTRTRKTNYLRSGLDYLKDKNDRELVLKERRLRVEERKVAVAEREIALEEKKFQLMCEQTKKVLEGQQEVINELLHIVKQLKN